MTINLDPEIAGALKPSGGPPLPKGDWKSRREGAGEAFAQINSLRPTPKGVATADYSVQVSDGASILLRWYTPDTRRAGDDPTSAVLFLHGGSMILGSVDHYDEIVQHYVAASGVPALAVDYRLAPEHPHPVPVDDCYAGLEWLAKHAEELEVDPGRIAVMGDSAGGALAAALAILARDRRGPAINRQILLYPMLDDRPLAQEPNLAAIATFTYDDNATGWAALLGDDCGSEHVSPSAAPARATDLHDLPPLYLEVGQADILCSQDIAYAMRMVDANVAVELHVHPGANHAFDIYAPNADVSQRAMADRIRVLRSV
jgi:acetyl esterase/lipase